MMRAFQIAVKLALPLLLVAQVAIAQEGQTSPQMEAINTIAHMVRWGGILISLFIVVGAWMLLRFVDKIVSNLGMIFAERRMLFQKIAAFFQFGVYLISALAIVLLSFKISYQVLAIVGGTAAVAIGFALKDLAASIVAGVMIMFDRPFQVGDRVSFGGQYGDITSIGMRSVKLQTLDDNTVTIPNNMFLNEVTSCGNYGALDMQVVIDFHIGVDQDVQLAQGTIREATAVSRYVFLSKPIVVLVSQVIIDHYVALRVRLKAYVFDIKYEKAFVSDVSLRVLDAFKDEGIQPPAVLHRTIESLPQAVPER
jgi:small-conductance mechanosensitive channel